MSRGAIHKASAFVLSMLTILGSACTRADVGSSSPRSAHDSSTVSASTSDRPSDGEGTESAVVTLLPAGPKLGAGTGDSDDAGSSGALQVPASVAVVGDSLTVATQDLIDKALRSAGASEVTIDGIEGRRMTGRSPGRPPGSEAIKDVLDSGLEPDTWVIELGTNDVGAQVHPKEFRADMESIISLLPSDATIVWVNIYVRGRAEATKQANTIIKSVAASRPHMFVADWYSLANNDPDLITSDGIHLRSSGEVAYSAMITEAIASAQTVTSDAKTSTSDGSTS